VTLSLPNDAVAIATASTVPLLRGTLFGNWESGPEGRHQVLVTIFMTPVCGEFQFRQQPGPETSPCGAVASDMSRSARAGAGVRHCAAPALVLPTPYDTDIGCRTPCSPRPSVRDRSGSKTGSDPDTRAGWFRSVTRRKHANAALRAWCGWRIAIHAALPV